MTPTRLPKPATRGASRPAKIIVPMLGDDQQWPVTTPDDKTAVTAVVNGLTSGFLTPERQVSSNELLTPGRKRSAESADLASLVYDLSKRRQVALPASVVMTAMPRARQATTDRSCSTCGTRTTPKWRGPCGNICNACGLAERKSNKPKRAPPTSAIKHCGSASATSHTSASLMPHVAPSFSIPVAFSYITAPGDPTPSRYASPRASALPAAGHNSKPPSAPRPSPVGSPRGNPLLVAPVRFRIPNATPEASPRASHWEELGQDEPKRNPFYTLGQLPYQTNLSGNSKPPSASRPSPVGSPRGNQFHERFAPVQLTRIQNATPEASPRSSYGGELGQDVPKKNPFYTAGQLPPQANHSGEELPEFNGSDLLMCTDEIELALGFPDNLLVAAAGVNPNL